MRQDVSAFLDSAPQATFQRINLEQIGHDFWLTRCRQGVGFWDRGLGDLGDELTELARSFGELHLYVGDDGKVHSE